MVVITAMNKSTQSRGCLAKSLQSAAMRRRTSTSRTIVITVSVVSVERKSVSVYTGLPPPTVFLPIKRRVESLESAVRSDCITRSRAIITIHNQ